MTSRRVEEISSLVFSSLVSLYVIWCIWSLHEALMIGGKAAEDAGFNADEVAHPPILPSSAIRDKMMKLLPSLFEAGNDAAPPVQAGESSPLLDQKGKNHDV